MRRLPSAGTFWRGGVWGRVNGRTAVSSAEPRWSALEQEPARSGSALQAAVSTARLTLIEARPVVLVVFTLRFCVGGLLASVAQPLNTWLAVAGHLSWVAAVWAVYLLNGATDRDEDRANCSTRPIASWLLSSKLALQLCAALASIALLLAAVVSLLFLALTSLLLVLGLVYSAGPRPAKRHGALALLIASSGVFLTYLAGAAAYAENLTIDVLVFAAVMSLWTLAVASTKDFGDMEGDAGAGRRTLPIVLGLRAAGAVTAVAAALVTVLASVAVFAIPALWPLALVPPAAAALCVRLAAVTTSAGRREVRRPYRVFMVSQYAVNGLAAMSVAIGSLRGSL